MDAMYMALKIAFKERFSHHSASRSETETVLFSLIDAKGLQGYGEGCPRSYVTGESMTSCADFYQTYARSLLQDVRNLSDLKHWIQDHETLIDRHPAAFCALEGALLDLWGKQEQKPLEELLERRPLRSSFQFSAVCGIGSPSSQKKIIERYLAIGMTDFKIKISGTIEDDKATLNLIQNGEGGGGRRIRLDGNNIWSDAAKAAQYIETLQTPLFGIEEPLQARDWQQMQELNRIRLEPLILDESCTNRQDFEHSASLGSKRMINLRVSKMGGLLRSLHILDLCRKQELGVIVGSQVGETSLLTRMGLCLASQAGKSLLAHEGAFGTHLLNRDITHPILMFGAKGLLEPGSFMASDAGMGLQIAEDEASLLPNNPVSWQRVA